MAANGFVYFSPIINKQVMVLNPANDSFVYIGTANSATEVYVGFTLAPNGNLYAPPQSLNSILKVEPSTNTVTRIAGVLGAQNPKYTGFVLGTDGNLYALPRTAPSVLKLNPTTDTITQIPFSIVYSSHFIRACLGFDGYIYGSAGHTPYTARYDYVNNTFTNIGAAMPTTSIKHGTILRSLDGRIFTGGENYFSSNFLISDYSSQRFAATNLISFSGVVLPNGDVLMCPLGSGTRMIRLISSYPKIYNFEGTIPANLADLPTSNYNVLHNRLT
jgi:hypothetical protein